MERDPRQTARRLLTPAFAAITLLAGCGGGSGNATPAPAAFIDPCSQLVACSGGTGDAAPAPAPAAFVDRCTQLVGKAVGSGTITSTKMIAASAPQPQTCSVQGQIVSSPTSTIKFQIDLPVDTAYNNKLLHVGGSGYNPVVATAETAFTSQGNNVRQRGYAIIGSDSGHQSASTFDLSWALNNPTAFDNFAFNSAPQVLAAGLDTVKIVYGVAPKYKYFYGTSTGGREALQQAQRFPDSYDGVVALEPALSYDASIQKGIQVAQAAFGSGGAGWISPFKAALFDGAQLAACDAADGLADGIISHPTACTFDPTTLRCPGGADTGNTCFSDNQLATIQAVRTDLTLPAPVANGVTVARRYGIGVEGDPLLGTGGGWVAMQFGASASQPFSGMYAFADQWLKYAVTSNAATTVTGYVLGSDTAKWMALSVKDNASNPDLSSFATHGKLILWHGWSDHLVPPGSSIDYYNSVVSKLGQAKTDSFMRFYMSPGVTHVTTGPGAGIVDRLTALEDWVEKGATPPDSLVGTKYAADGTSVVRTRPTCRYPAWPKYSGSGDVNAAASFKCVTE